MARKEEIQELSKQLNIPEETVEKILKDVSKPSLDNIDCPQNYDIGIGPSDKD